MHSHLRQFLLEAAFVDMRLDVPRCSGSAEFLSFTCASTTVVAPAAAEYTEDLMPSMDTVRVMWLVVKSSGMPTIAIIIEVNDCLARCRLPNSHDLRARRMAHSKPVSGSDWHDVVSRINFDQHSSAPWAFRRPSHRYCMRNCNRYAAVVDEGEKLVNILTWTSRISNSHSHVHVGTSTSWHPCWLLDHQAALDVHLPNDLHTKFDLTSGMLHCRTKCFICIWSGKQLLVSVS